MKFGFVAKHRGIWPTDWLCEALGVSRGGFYAWLTRPRSQRSRSEEELGAKVRASFLASDRTYGARRVWHDLLAEGVRCGLHRIERLMRQQALKARPRRRRLPPDLGERQVAAVAPNVLDRSFEAPAPNRKWIADFTYVWTAEGWLYVAAVVDLFSRRVVGWSMSTAMTAQLVTDALVMAIWRRGKPDALLHHSDRGSQYTSEQFQRLMADHGVVCSMSRSGNVWDNAAMESFFSSPSPKLSKASESQIKFARNPLLQTNYRQTQLSKHADSKFQINDLGILHGRRGRPPGRRHSEPSALGQQMVSVIAWYQRPAVAPDRGRQLWREGRSDYPPRDIQRCRMPRRRQ